GRPPVLRRGRRGLLQPPVHGRAGDPVSGAEAAVGAASGILRQPGAALRPGAIRTGASPSGRPEAAPYLRAAGSVPARPAIDALPPRPPLPPVPRPRSPARGAPPRRRRRRAGG